MYRHKYGTNPVHRTSKKDVQGVQARKDFEGNADKLKRFVAFVYNFVACDEVMNMYRDEEKLSNHPREYWEHNIRQWVQDEQARYAIEKNFLDRVPYEKIAEDLGVTRGTVYNKISKYAPKLFDHCD